ncbi:MAG: DNA-3-methyladenine glycosylase I [Flavobacteriales bacterium]|jgi:DNA-3-methyladenine glycosylase I|nr:DNA-3-methyladenine glycosylase I [Flavobacteriales bacterium]
MKKRCSWSEKTESEIHYHDQEWGVPVHDDRLLFELLTLEGAQAGLSWATVLNKRTAYKEAFDDFDWEIVAKYGERKIDELLSNKGIVRNKLKVNSVVSNAKAFIKVREEFGSFDKYIWSFTNYKVIQNQWKTAQEVPARTSLSDSISKDLKKRGFKFIGTTICYAFLQGIGVVNDHTTDCFRYNELK